MASGGNNNVSQIIPDNLLKQAPNYMVDLYHMRGTTEYLPSNKNKDNPAIKAMFEYIGYPGSPRKVPWCAIGANFFLEKRGWKTPKKANARSFLDWGQKITEPQIGDLAILWRGSYDDGWSGHVTFVVKVTKNYIYGLGCNQGDSITIGRFPKKKLLGYRRPRNVPIVSKTIISGAGSATTGASAEAVKQIDKVIPSTNITDAPSNSIDAINNAVDVARPLGDLLPTIGIILTIVSVALALLTIYWRYKDYKETGL